MSILQSFVTQLVESGALKEEWVKNALLNVPRHLFVDQYYQSEKGDPIIVDRHNPTEDQLKRIYDIKKGCVRRFEPPFHTAVSSPLVVTAMLEALNVQNGQRILEIGAGSGWNAGLLACGGLPVFAARGESGAYWR